MENNSKDYYEIDIAFLAHRLLYKKSIFGIILALSLIPSALYALISTKEFKSEALLKPQTHDTTNLSQLSSSFGNIASLAGIKLNSSTEEARETIAILESKDFINDFLSDERIAKEVFFTLWNEEISSWRSPSTTTYIKRLISGSQTPGLHGPTTEEAYETFIKEHLGLKEDDNGFVSVSMIAHSPQAAQMLLVQLISNVNEYTRSRDLKENQKRLNYLYKKLEQSNSVELKLSINSLIESHIKTEMLTRVSDEYALKIIDYPNLTDRLYRPNIKAALTVFLILGLTLSFILNLWLSRNAMGHVAEPNLKNTTSADARQ